MFRLWWICSPLQMKRRSPTCPCTEPRPRLLGRAVASAQHRHHSARPLHYRILGHALHYRPTSLSGERDHLPIQSGVSEALLSGRVMKIRRQWSYAERLVVSVKSMKMDDLTHQVPQYTCVVQEAWPLLIFQLERQRRETGLQAPRLRSGSDDS